MPLLPIPSRSKNFSAFADGSLLVIRYHGTAVASDYAETTEIIKQTARKAGTKISMVSLVVTTSAKLDDASREAVKVQTRETEAISLGSAVIITSGSLTAMVVRTIVNGLSAFSGSKAPMKAFTDVGEGLKWLEKLPGQVPGFSKLASVNELEALARELKAA